MQMKNRGTTAASICIGMDTYHLDEMACLKVRHNTNDTRDKLMIVRTILRLRKNLWRDSAGVNSVLPILILLASGRTRPCIWQKARLSLSIR